MSCCEWTHTLTEAHKHSHQQSGIRHWQYIESVAVLGPCDGHILLIAVWVTDWPCWSIPWISKAWTEGFNYCAFHSIKEYKEWQSHKDIITNIKKNPVSQFHIIRSRHVSNPNEIFWCVWTPRSQQAWRCYPFLCLCSPIEGCLSLTHILCLSLLLSLNT